MLEVQPIETTHDREIGRRYRTRQVSQRCRGCNIRGLPIAELLSPAPPVAGCATSQVVVEKEAHFEY